MVSTPTTIELGGPGNPAITVDEMVPGGSFKGHGDPNDLDIPARIGQGYVDLDSGDQWVKLTDDGWTRESDIEGVTSTGSTISRDVADRFSEIHNLRDFGTTTDGLSALNAALAVWNQIVIDGVFSVSDNLTIASGKVLIFNPGGKLKPASGKKITLNCGVVAPRTAIFDFSASGKVVFGPFSNTETILVEWYGLVGDNSTANDTAFSRLLDSSFTSTENTQELDFGIGYYNVASPITWRSNTAARGVFEKTRIQWASPSSSGSLIVLPTGVDKVRFTDLQFNTFSAGAGIRTTAIGQTNATDNVSNLLIENCIFTSFNQYGVNLGQAIYVDVLRSRFTDISNRTSLGGTGDGSAYCVNLQTYGNGVLIGEGTRSGNCEGLLKSASSSGLKITTGRFEQDATASTKIDTIANLGHFIDIQGASIQSADCSVDDNYFEGIRTLTTKAIVNFTNVNAYCSKGNTFKGLRPAGSTAVCSIFVAAGAGCHGGIVTGNEFYGTPSLYIVVNGTSEPASCPANVFRDNTGAYFTTLTSVLRAKLSNISELSIADAYHFFVPTVARKVTGVAGISRALTVTKDSNGSNGAAGDGVEIGLTGFNASAAEKDFAKLQAVLTTATASSETADYVINLIKTGTLTEVLRIIGTGGMKIPVGTVPSAPAANKATLYVDTTGGKVRLSVLFPTGSAQVLAIEP